MAAAPDPHSDSDQAPERLHAIAVAGATALRLQLDALLGSTDPSDQALVKRFQAGCKRAMRAVTLYEEVAFDSPHRAQVKKLVVKCGEQVAEDIARIGERASWLADATPKPARETAQFGCRARAGPRHVARRALAGPVPRGLRHSVPARRWPPPGSELRTQDIAPSP